LPIEIATVVPPNPAHETLTPRRTHTQNVDGIAELPSTQSEDSSDFDVEKADDYAIEQQANWQKAASIDGGTFGEFQLIFFLFSMPVSLTSSATSRLVDNDFPCFHIDLATAVAAADRNKE